MSLENMSKEEIELLSYTDLAYKLLVEGKKSMNTPVIFKTISDLLEYTESQYMDKIGDFYTSLTLDKRFILLDNNDWDIRDRHAAEIILEEDDVAEEEIEEEELEEESVETEELDDLNMNLEDELEDDLEDDLAGLSIISEDEEEEE